MHPRLLVPVMAVAAILSAGPSAVAVPHGTTLTRIVVVTRDAPTLTVAKREAVLADGVVTATWSHALRGFAAQVPSSVAKRLAAVPGVVDVELDRRMSATTSQSNPTWGLDRIDQRALPLDHSFTYTSTGKGVRAYVVDTGIRLTHTDFGGRAITGVDLVDGGAANDCNGHGTHVAGTIGGRVRGVAKQVTLVAVRVLDCYGSGSISRIVSGLDWVARDHAAGAPAVANMSLGGSPSSAVDDAVRGVISDGVTVVVAAGNDGGDACDGSPSRVTAAITVSAADSADDKPDWANYGSCVDLFAPGVRIYSDWVSSDTATKTLDGTSMATPHVTGAAALYLQTHPSATPATVRSAIVRASTTYAVHYSDTPYARLLFTAW